MYDVFLVFVDGSRQLLFENADLDYWNIRQWRLLYFRLSEANRKEYCTLSIVPKLHEAFAKLSPSFDHH